MDHCINYQLLPFLIVGKMVRKSFGIIVTICIVLCSCGTAKKAQPTEADMILANYKSNDIASMILDLEKYPLSRNLTESLLYTKDYSGTPYSELKEYAILSDFDFKASAFFDSLKFERQEKVLDSLSHLNLQQIGNFYRQNYSEHDYLRAALMPLFANVNSLDYTSLKSLNRAFMSTNLQGCVTPRYNAVRDSLLYEINQSVDEYFDVEYSMLEDIELAVRSVCEDYIENGVVKIVSSLAEKNDRGFFKRIFKRINIDSYSFEEYADILIKDNLDPSYIKKVTRERLTEWIDNSSRYREELLQSYFGNSPDANTLQRQQVINIPFVWTIGRHDINTITDIKMTGTVLTVGSLALGFIPGIGALAVAADVADFAYGMSQDTKISNAMNQLSRTLYEDSTDSVGKYLDSVFNTVKSEIDNSKIATKRKFHEEF